MNDFEFDEPVNTGINEVSKKNNCTEPLTKAELEQMTLLDKLEALIDISRKSKLKKEFFNRHNLLIQSVANGLALTPGQAVILCPFIDSPDTFLNYNNLQHFFNSSSISIMKHKDDLTELVHRRYLQRGRYSNNSSFRLSDKAQKNLCDNKGVPAVKIKDLTPGEFMSFFRNIVHESENLNQLDEDELLTETMELLDNNPQLDIVKAINHLKVSDQEKFVMLRYCKALVVDGEEGLPLNQFDDNIDDFYDFANAMINGTHPFVTQELLLPVASNNLFNRDVYGLTPKARKLFLKDYSLPKRDMTQQNIANAKLIKHKDIKPKTLFYSAEDQDQIGTLQGLLTDRQLKEVRKRLASANLRKGFNCLFYGTPGTGKTETALQLAHSTGRDIMQVDISTMRDKWYGETEKIVKGIFDDYARLVKHSKRIPILLINEADALLSVRTGIGGTNPGIEKTENAIQNILLEAMENIDGIMIATTNLTCNLDSAFERRFLYKVEFHQPSIEAKTSIWQSFIPDLNGTDATKLARAYDFSGGQIENIARKVMVDHLLFGDKPDIVNIEKLCSQELIAGRHNNHKPIGFNH